MTRGQQHFESYEQIERAARRRLPRSVYGEVVGGRERGVTLRENVLAFDRVMLRPRAAVATSDRNLRTKILGTEVSMPVLLDPVGALRLIHPDGAVAAARAATAAETICAVSMVAGHSVAEIRRDAAGPLWQQLYMFNGRQYAEQLIGEAKDQGYAALVVTVDYPVPAKAASALAINLKTAVAYAPELMVRPRWLLNFIRDGMRVSVANNLSGRSGVYTAVWDDFSWIADQWAGPIVIKGIITAEDARRAVDAGASGIVVSNHGGLVLDGTPGTLSVLPEICRAVGDSVEVLLDGGVRQGTDVVKALALGAKAVMIGRPYVLGLGAAGESGVRGVLEMFRTEVDRALGMVGCQDVAQLDESFVIAPDRAPE